MHPFEEMDDLCELDARTGLPLLLEFMLYSIHSLAIDINNTVDRDVMIHGEINFRTALPSYAIYENYFRTFLACLTRFSITPSKASLSPSFSSVFFVQYSSTSCAVLCMASKTLVWSFSSSIVRPFNASSVVVHTCLAKTRSSCGAGGGPFFRLESEREGLPWESRDVLEAFSSPCFRRDIERESVDVRGEPEVGLRCIDGRISFFCLDAGRISSRSTGTPRETRKRRRIRDRIQF